MLLNREPPLEAVLCDVSLPGNASLSSKPSILIIDADALPFPLLPFLRTARTAFGDAPILVIGKRLSDEGLRGLVLHGVRGFIIYENVEQEICAAAEAVLRGRMWYPPQVLERCAMLSSALARRNWGERGALSPRESEVIGLLQRRLSNKEIGCALGISERTVRFHLHNIFQKVGVQGRYGLVDFARDAGPAESRGEVPVWKTA
jgi:DNA-binding NarL/FixJ family response regulator